MELALSIRAITTNIIICNHKLLSHYYRLSFVLSFPVLVLMMHQCAATLQFFAYVYAKSKKKRKLPIDHFVKFSCANVIETPTWYFAIYCRACSSDEARTRVSDVFVEAERTQRPNVLLTEGETSTFCP